MSVLICVQTVCKDDQQTAKVAASKRWRLKVLQNAPLGAFCNTFDLHKAIIGLENQFMVFLRVAVLHRFYCISFRLTTTVVEMVQRQHWAWIQPGHQNGVQRRQRTIDRRQYVRGRSFKIHLCCSKCCRRGPDSGSRDCHRWVYLYPTSFYYNCLPNKHFHPAAWLFVF